MVPWEELFFPEWVQLAWVHRGWALVAPVWAADMDTDMATFLDMEAWEWAHSK